MSSHPFPATIRRSHPPLQAPVQPWRFHWQPGRSLTWLVPIALPFLTPCFATAQTPASKDVEIQVGVVQRFGTRPTDTLTLQARSGDRLTVRFQTEGKPQTLSTSSAKLDVVMQPLPQPQLEERVVLSTHRSFESAEDDANRWRSQGIEVEVAQPERWQVWAKRSVYSTPLVRRMLLQSIQAKGIQTPYIDTRLLTQQPRASLVINGFRYTRDRVEISAGQQMIQVGRASNDQNRRIYGGSLRLQPNTYGTYTLVNQVSVETYLRGVVPHEIGTWAAPAVLETQAILARTYALRNLRRFAIDGYQLCADTQCQVYEGLSGTAPSTDRAIAATRSLVLTYQNELVDAVYSSTTGGVTAAFNDAWHGPARPYLRPVIDSVGSLWDLSRQSLADESNFRAFIGRKKGFNEEGGEWFRWRVESRLETMTQQLQSYLVQKKHPMAGFRTIQRVDVVQRSISGRVLRLRVTTDRGPIDLEKDMILIAFEAPNSTLFYLEPVYGAGRVLKGYAFVGGGLGHGVGLSQVGSYHLGKLGWSSDRILGFYFPGTRLQPLNEAITFWRG